MINQNKHVKKPANFALINFNFYVIFDLTMINYCFQSTSAKIPISKIVSCGFSLYFLKAWRKNNK